MVEEFVCEFHAQFTVQNERKQAHELVVSEGYLFLSVVIRLRNSQASIRLHFLP